MGRTRGAFAAFPGALAGSWVGCRVASLPASPTGALINVTGPNPENMARRIPLAAPHLPHTHLLARSSCLLPCIGSGAQEPRPLGQPACGTSRFTGSRRMIGVMGVRRQCPPPRGLKGHLGPHLSSCKSLSPLISGNECQQASAAHPSSLPDSQSILGAGAEGKEDEGPSYLLT